MFKPYAIRRGYVKFEEQTEKMNRETKSATVEAMHELFLSSQYLSIIKKNLIKYYPQNINLHADLIASLHELDSANEINTFIEIVFYSLVFDSDYNIYYRDYLDVAIKSLNEVFVYRKYMYIINSSTFQVYPYSDEETNAELEEILSIDDQISKNISEAMKNYTKTPGGAIHSATKALEFFFISELKLSGKTLQPLIQSFKSHKKFQGFSAPYKLILESILDRVKTLRNNGVDAGHPGNEIISVVEARLTILNIVNFINATRMV